ncbi:MAG: DegQ family serine endoprotease [Nitrospiraceae bacterium]|nr:DegQ family serine endoprotease [Nitrospiraceae bacterium]
MKKTVWAISLLVVGCLTGWFLFYRFGNELGLPARRSGTSRPVVIPFAGGLRDFSGIVKGVSPSVVNISSQRLVRKESDGTVEGKGPLQDEPKTRSEQSLGSGVIVSSDGYIITNNHVIADSEDISVTLLDERTFEGKIIGTDPKSDIALLKIDATGLPAIKWGDSDAIEPGQFALAIGNPFSLSHTITMGIISAVGRANVGIADYEDFIQTDAAINPGNSGGPLVDVNGEVIGINTAIFSRSGGYQGIGFAVPSNMAREIMEQLKTNGKVVRGWIGVTMQDLTPGLADKFGLPSAQGALVSDVTPGSPAARSGIRRGDTIVGFGGKPVESPAVFKNMVAETGPGRRISIDVLRGRQKLRIHASLGQYPLDLAQSAESMVPHAEVHRSAFVGLGVMDLTRDIIRQLGLPAGERGVIVSDVDEDSPSGEGGLRRGDVIEEVERRPVRALSDFNAVVARLSGTGKPVLLLVNRSGKRSYVLLKQN